MPETRLVLDVFGQQVLVTREGAAWTAYYVGSEGKRRLAHDIVIPSDLATAEKIATYLADLFHEHASERHPVVTLLEVRTGTTAQMGDVTLVEPAREFDEAFRDMAAEWGEVPDKFQGALGDFGRYVADLERQKDSAALAPGFVPQSTFWLVTDSGRVVGTSRLRHWLVPDLVVEGGHIGYDIRPSERRKGYGTILLRLTLEEARKLGLREVVVTCDSDNVASVRIIEKNGGQKIGTAVSPESGKWVDRYRIQLEAHEG